MTRERHAEEPLFALVRMIRGAVEDPVRSAGGNDRDVEAIAVAAAYAAWCWGAAPSADIEPPGLNRMPA
ncbi:hypothetical protein [Mycolicibacterium diernhoferi]|uniref:hypothetical protein n=1 Tax=Mycolicibacterium diernhoferi TaxID=1801 RepID=UPI000AEAA74C|nr:hypothetical protein [Mycolicibacterium diernhoferi]QYL20535.1 hypothetical protein K0O62_15680 [Mycolicibacterium diernhoferi]